LAFFDEIGNINTSSNLSYIVSKLFTSFFTKRHFEPRQAHFETTLHLFSHFRHLFELRAVSFELSLGERGA
jgi:hypothetical protein